MPSFRPAWPFLLLLTLALGLGCTPRRGGGGGGDDDDSSDDDDTVADDDDTAVDDDDTAVDDDDTVADDDDTDPDGPLAWLVFDLRDSDGMLQALGRCNMIGDANPPGGWALQSGACEPTGNPAPPMNEVVGFESWEATTSGSGGFGNLAVQAGDFQVVTEVDEIQVTEDDFGEPSEFFMTFQPFELEGPFGYVIVTAQASGRIGLGR